MFKKMSLSLMFIALALLINAVISAHDTWLVPDKYKCEVGESVTLGINTGMEFPVSTAAVNPDRLSAFFVTGQSGEMTPEKFEEADNALVTKVTFSEAGTYVAATATKQREIKLTAEQFNDYLIHDGLKSVYELRKRENLLEEDAVELYAKHPKTIILVGGKLDDTPTKPVGMLIEIVPNVNPYSLKAGDYLEVTVLFRGEPLPGAEVAWSRPGTGEGFVGETRCDDKGVATIPLELQGPIVIRMIHMIRVDAATHGWESYWASVTFEIQ